MRLFEPCRMLSSGEPRIDLVAGAFLFAFGFLLFTHRLTRLSSWFTKRSAWLHLDALTRV